ncbi:MAG: methionine biosynthesis protein MetW [Sulfuricellaceae bacterium]|nr:methionine biosynthesis protein MetW [Sulfuricellaceae bacterium]
MNAAPVRHDFETIAAWVKPGSRVLDLGCGDGTLLRYLKTARQAHGYGVEIDDANILACLEKGLNVIQNDLDAGLSGFEADSFDFVILSQTLQAMRHIEQVVSEMLRVGKAAIVAVPNFGYWRHRVQVLQGHMPVSPNLPHHWYDTPNIHLCTLRDFESFCGERHIRILERVVMAGGKEVSVLPNIRGSMAAYRIERA